MHQVAMDNMNRMLLDAPSWTAVVLDVGSLDVNGTCRPLVEARGWKYTGVDIQLGENVSHVVEPYNFGFEDEIFDVVISSQTMEHVEDLKLWINEIVRVLKPGGRICITTVWKMFHHPYPIDTWRIMPDGMRWLFNQNGNLFRYDIFADDEGNISGAASKKANQ